MERVREEIEQRLQEEQTTTDLLDTIPGMSRRTAEIVLAEIGTDMNRFLSAKHFASWAGICPGNAERREKLVRGKTRKRRVWVRQRLIDVAHVASKTKHTYVAAHYRRIAARRGK